MSKRLELVTLVIKILVVCIFFRYGNVCTAEHYDKSFFLRLYHHEGTPHFQTPVSSDTIIAGTSDTLVAKIFDRNNVWYPEYEKPDSGRMYIRWKVEVQHGSAPTENYFQIPSGIF